MSCAIGLPCLGVERLAVKYDEPARTHPRMIQDARCLVCFIKPKMFDSVARLCVMVAVSTRNIIREVSLVYWLVQV